MKPGNGPQPGSANGVRPGSRSASAMPQAFVSFGIAAGVSLFYLARLMGVDHSTQPTVAYCPTGVPRELLPRLGVPRVACTIGSTQPNQSDELRRRTAMRCRPDACSSLTWLASSALEELSSNRLERLLVCPFRHIIAAKR